ncbi:hypothetical protein HYH03_005206 [Edaphochlamys debaryana]|uniref:PI31 proteasome regulator C-terminal domain-containing protein n=1 Tax=Edaphochlamys debaryana TaxID=47281 RepID=A0A835Y804_9CHLO|nr:hypothetical protein HYH03_005206 [Edaphochlamys debaryana]|eukprot:KAG2496799.1 hypothetical protein HYH03_005206 [Edaphochlamys debaryana]
MATPQAVTALVRAARPDFSSKADKLVFAIHATLSVNGFSLRKLGQGVDEAVTQGASTLPAEEIDITGWSQPAEDGTLAFLYVPEPGTASAKAAGSAPLLLVKCLPLEGDGGDAGGSLIVSLADTASGKPPASLDLPVDRYVPALAPGAQGYKELPELISKVEGALADALEGGGAGKAAAAAKATASTSASGRTAPTSQQQQREEAEEQERRRREEVEERRRGDPLRDPLIDDSYHRPGMGVLRPPGWGGVGDEDLMPGGLPRPMPMGGPFGVGGVPLGPRGGGGGMHVGPENPMFSDRLRHPHRGPGLGPGMGGPGGGVPGMRWDPINPEGLQGFHPDDFTQPGGARREGLNDIGGPPPGRGADWDEMYG